MASGMRQLSIRCDACAIDAVAGIFQGGYGPDAATAGADAMTKLGGGYVAAVHCSH
jgi:hypothetical protein